MDKHILDLYNQALKDYDDAIQKLMRIKNVAEENIMIADLEGLSGVYRRGLAEQILQIINAGGAL